jgi:hypothetical protein
MIFFLDGNKSHQEKLKMITISKRFFGNEKADGDVPADAWAMAVIKVSCILVIGVVILGGITTASNITAGSPFYAMYQSVVNNINSGYSLAALMVLAIGSGAILHFLGFM